MAEATLYIIAFCVLPDFQRSGADTNMTKDEFLAGQWDQKQEMLTIEVLNHKTSSLGTANIVLPQNVYHLVQQYSIIIRPLVTGKRTKYTNLSGEGRLYKLFQRAGLPKYNLTKFRKAIAFAAVGTLTDAEITLLQSNSHTQDPPQRNVLNVKNPNPLRHSNS